MNRPTYRVDVVERFNPELRASFFVRARDERAARRSARDRARRAVERACTRLGPCRRYVFDAVETVLVLPAGAP